MFKGIRKSGVAILLAFLLVVSVVFSACGKAQESSWISESSESELSAPEEPSESSESELSATEESSESSESESSATEESSESSESESSAAEESSESSESESSAAEESSESSESESSAAEESSESSESESSVPEQSSESESSEPEKDYAAKKIFVYDLSGGLLYNKGEMEEAIFPASITKLAAALTALEIADPQMICTVGDELELVASDASIAYVRKGHELTVEMLIEAMLLPSGCDAAYVLAANVGRILEPKAANAKEAVEAFIAEMNDWSERNGFVNTVWENPDGYHAEGHYSCLADLLKLGKLSLGNEIVMKYTSTAYEKVTYASGHINEWSNTNQLLNSGGDYYNPYCIGLKTGTTNKAGACLISAFEKDGKVGIIGVFGCEDSYYRYSVTNQLYEDFLK